MVLATSSPLSLAAAAISLSRSSPSNSRMNSSFRSLRSSERKLPVRFWLEKMLERKKSGVPAHLRIKLLKGLLLAVGERFALPVEEIALHLAGLGIDLEERPVAGAIDTECQVDFGLGMGGEVIKRTLLAGQLAEQGSEYRSDQRGLAGAVLAHDGD